MIKQLIVSYYQKNPMLFLTVLACIVVGLLSLLFLPKDNPIEQAMEDVIEKETGAKIDLTPG